MRYLVLVLGFLGCDSPSDSTVLAEPTCEEAMRALCDALFQCPGIAWSFDADHTVGTAADCRIALTTDGYVDNGHPGFGLGCKFNDGNSYVECKQKAEDVAFVCEDGPNASSTVALRACDRPL